MAQQSDFNSHTREGVTNGETYFRRTKSFQLTHPWGCDLPLWLRFGLLQIFQLTHPWGCDYNQLTLNSNFQHFNSHTREGVTFLHIKLSNLIIFQLTHPWGCDWCCVQSGQVSTHFNSHTREGVTGGGIMFPYPFLDFNSHTREGVTKNKVLDYSADIFQLTHPWGCDGLFRGYIRTNGNFNSHTREGVTLNACNG